jgi:hypothetical protein
MPTQLSCRDISEFDLDIHAPGDLLTIQGGVEQYLRLLNLAPLERQRVAPVEEVHPFQKPGAEVGLSPDPAADGHLPPLEEALEVDDASGGHATPLASIHVASAPAFVPAPAELPPLPEGDVNPDVEVVEGLSVAKPDEAIGESQGPQGDERQPPDAELVEELPSDPSDTAADKPPPEEAGPVCTIVLVA